MAEMLTGIRVVKFMSWEPYFAEKVHQARTKELKYLKGRKYLDAICVYLWCTTPVLISVVTFATYVLLGNTLTAAKVKHTVILPKGPYFNYVSTQGYLLGLQNAKFGELQGTVVKMLTRVLSWSKIDKNVLT